MARAAGSFTWRRRKSRFAVTSQPPSPRASCSNMWVNSCGVSMLAMGMPHSSTVAKGEVTQRCWAEGAASSSALRSATTGKRTRGTAPTLRRVLTRRAHVALGGVAFSHALMTFWLAWQRYELVHQRTFDLALYARA